MKYFLSILLLLFIFSANSASTSAIDSALASSYCKNIGNFYWEVGNKDGVVYSGQVGSTYSRTTSMPIASSSKLIYAAYVAEKHKGIYSSDDIRFLNFTSGYTEFQKCNIYDSIGTCASLVIFHPENVNKFDYSGGHMEKHAATVMGLSNLKSSDFSKEINSTLGTSFVYTYPQPAAGARASAANYAVLLNKILNNKIELGLHLNENLVCTSYSICPDKAVYGASPSPEPWSFSMGYWYENQPVTGDNTSSAPGALGFYPWVNKATGTYGILARNSQSLRAGWNSVQCGREIRKAYLQN